MKSMSRILCAVVAIACATTLYAEPVSIHQAARAGDLPAVYVFIADGVSINTADADGMTALHCAADNAQAETVQALLAAGADVRVRDAAGRTALHYAARAGQGAIVEQLLAHGAAVNATDVRGNTALHWAASRARPGTVGLLLAAGADVNARNEAGQTPLHVLGTNLRPDVDDAVVQELVDGLAHALIAAGADPTIRDSDGRAAWPHVTPVTEPLQPSGYPTYDQIAATLLTKASTYPTLCQRFDLGTTSTTQHLYALKMTSNVGVEADKPEFAWVSTLHGDEVTGVVLCLDMIDYLLTNYGSVSRVTNLLNNVEIWFVPCANPYGYTNNTRYNANGYDLNRSFPEGSGSSPDPNTPAGPPEVVTFMNWGYAHSFTLGVNYHGGSLVCNYPFDNDGLGSVDSPSPDDDVFEYISLQYSSHNAPMYGSSEFYHGITNGAAWYAIDGGMQDWFYRYAGANHITIEVSSTKSPAYSDMPTYWSQNQESMLSFMETCLIGARGIVTDAATGAPLAATVTVVGRNHTIGTDPDVGDYHRMLLPGTYQLTFAAAGHESRTLPVTVASGPATRLDVTLGGPPHITSPNGGESLTVGLPTNVTWTGAPTTQFQVQQSSNYGQTGPTTDGFESGSLGSAYTTGGNLPWSVATTSPHAGTYCARAGAITHSQTSWMTRTALGGSLSFYYKVSSEGGADLFTFYIDSNTPVFTKSGTIIWTQYTTTLSAGTHTLKWQYTKDASVNGGADTVWIDDLTLNGDATSWTDIIALTPVGATSTPWTPSVVSSINKVRARTYFGSGSYSSWDDSDAVFSVVAAPQGACCATDGSCTVTTQAGCTGTWQGAATTCTPNPCPQPQGACCAGNGSCTVTTQALCTGTYQGNGTTCTPNPCPQPQGACCAGNGSCTVTTQALCTGTYQGNGTTCTPNPCPPAGCAGDVNCDGRVTFTDIDLFVEALSGESAWTHTCPWINADCNGDLHVTFADIDPFVGLIGTTCP